MATDESRTTVTDTRAGPVYVEHLRLALASLDASRAFLVRELDHATKGNYIFDSPIIPG